MDASREIEMKKHVIDALKKFLMSDVDGSKFKPKEVSVEMVGEPQEVKGKAGLGDFLKDASENAPEMDDEESPTEDMGEDEDTETKKMSPREFFKRK